MRRLTAALEYDPASPEVAQQRNLAVFAGSLVERYLATFERDPGDLRMPGTYQARWLHQRFRPFLPRVQWEGAPAELTVDHIVALLGRLK